MQHTIQHRPFILDQLRALLRRLPVHHPKYEEVLQFYKRFDAGFAGEQSIGYHLNFLRDQAFIYQGLSLELKEKNIKFQVDLILVTPYFLYIGEVKNYSGALQFDLERSQLIRTIENRSEVFACPVAQVDRHARLIKLWLQQHKIPSLPIIPHVIVSNRRAQIAAPPHHPGIYHSDGLLKQFDRLIQTYPKRVLSKNQLARLDKQIQLSHVDTGTNLLQRFDLHVNDILGPPRCSSCRSSRFIPGYQTWSCQDCRITTRNAHVSCLYDISLLINEPLKRKAFNHLLEHLSKQSILRLLRQYAVYDGKGYVLSPEKFPASAGNTKV
ncbi:nuclease-related domain-containing protein [Alkalicoccus urumqiensis]|uniref:NERD domain-containing protein n=1 Tax=Alkalicoccus urumqiensis TaxID=1548213 RepID=A0A2P6MIE6_ALKUR|nr:nuclease-related domain-containing protein [Alkalicoccus urumqiensis]PRO66075.1 hypothetical protein C6I21_07185 [Alkalicoccus urumqiensis]